LEFSEVVRRRHMVREFTEGLAALYFGIVPEAVGPFHAAFGVPDDHEPIGAIAIGHSAEAAPRDLRARRRPGHEVIHYGRW
jgi:hypothetical protein